MNLRPPTVPTRSLTGIGAALAALAAGPAAAQIAQSDESIDEIVVTVTPVGGATGLRREKIPYDIQTAIADDLERMQGLHLGEFLNWTMGSVSINDAQNNPLQPDISYRGFTVSPLLGLAQGMAVYQDGVRINEPLGDTVNWDLLPQTAIRSIHLVGGANPVFGLNTLGGALAVDMKNGFTAPGHHLELRGGSFGRAVVSAETGGNRDGFAWYGNAHYFDESGWRDLSPSDAANLYGSLGWQRGDSLLNVNGQYGSSKLTGNGPAPVELLQVDREAIFTAPDITENSMYMLSLDGTHRISDTVELSGSVFFRRNETDSFNGDASQFTVCRIGTADALLEGLEGDDLEELGLEHGDVCAGQFAGADELEEFLNDHAVSAGEEPEFDLGDLSDQLSGSGVLADAAINNVSTRVQRSYGTDLQMALSNGLFGRGNQFVAGASWLTGKSAFDALLELANLDPFTRSTAGLGTGTFVDGAATDIRTDAETWSVYFTNTTELDDRFSLTVSGRYNHTRIELADQSGERPELNGKHTFARFNPAVGLTWQASNELNLYGSYSESSRAPTPVELACNDHIFELAVENAIAAGEDPDDIDFECRLPNAFLADPPLEQVVAKSFEVGARWDLESLGAHLGLFHTTNHDDILFQTTGRATGLFANVDKTRRRGVESRFSGRWRDLDWFLAYSYIEATFEAPFAALSPNHPLADRDGTVQVRAGDRIPGVPAHHAKAGVEYRFGDGFGVGFDAFHTSGQHMRGDESNQLEKTDDFLIVSLRGQYRLNEHLLFFATVRNLLDTKYETFGLIGEEPGEVDAPGLAGFEDPRFLGPGAPRAAFVGVKLSL